MTNKITQLQLVAKNIKRFRELKDFSQNVLAEKLGISREHLAKVETAKRYASLQLIFRIAETLEVEVKELFDF